jgi:ubiquinol-cytochrome c reductase iron-sulfur subunit
MPAHISSLNQHPEPSRRDFLTLSATAFVGVGISASIWPFLDNLNPSAETKAQATMEVDLRAVQPGQIITVRWQGKAVFIAHRTPEQITNAEADDTAATLDPARDRDRVKRKEWLVVVGVCTHLGCIPISRGAGDLMPRFGGWVCPCHYSQYDISGRVRRGPAPSNLIVPPYSFTDDDTLVIGCLHLIDRRSCLPTLTVTDQHLIFQQHAFRP